MTLEPDQYGFFHPSSEEEIVSLVNRAREEKKTLRVTGSAHSQSWAIYTDPITAEPNVTNRETPPESSNFNLILDQLMDVELIDEEQHIVRAQAGVHLGYDPSDITGTSTLENSLLYQLWNNWQLTLTELGGIIHQTVGGFMSTGSAGGSLRYSFQEDIVAIRFVDGNGIVRTVSREDDDPSMFYAVMVSLGTCGVIVSVDFKCVPAFNIVGQEATVTYEECKFDFFGDDHQRPTFLEFLKDVDYARVNWWPQPGAQRLIPWQAQAQRQVVGFTPSPYQEFTNFPEVAEPVFSIIFAILGNLEVPREIPAKVEPARKALIKVADHMIPWHHFGPIAKEMEEIFNALLTEKFEEFIAAVELAAPLLRAELPKVMQTILEIFQPLDSSKKGMNKGSPQLFQDHAPWGLPMDNQASDTLMDIEFSELWFPVGQANLVTQTLRDFFEAAQNPHEMLDRTGLFMIEVYMAKACDAWLGMGYSDGQDEWKDGAVRFEPLWFVDFHENPAEEFYPQFWKLFRDKGIPFRLHWGKMLPNIQEGDPDGWAAFIRAQFPRWDDFMAVRAELDPEQIFLTSYWRKHFMIAGE